MNIAKELETGRINEVCEVKVLLPTGAKVFQADQGPERLVAVE